MSTSAHLAAVLAENLEHALDGPRPELGDRPVVLEWLSVTTRIPPAELELYTTGRELPCPRKLTKIAHALGTTTDALLTEPAL